MTEQNIILHEKNATDFKSGNNDPIINISFKRLEELVQGIISAIEPTKNELITIYQDGIKTGVDKLADLLKSEAK